MTDALIKEQFSVHLLKMMASLAGYVVGTNNLDIGIDFQLMKVEQYRSVENRRRYFMSGKGIDIQLKTTSNFQITGDGRFVKFDLDATNLNDLEQRRLSRDEYLGGIMPLVLLVHCIPSNKDDLLSVLPDNIQINGKILWYYPQEAIKFTGRKSTERIFIPSENQVDLKFFDKVTEMFYQKSKK